MTAKIAKGTTIEVLAPYLPYGIEVQPREGGVGEKLIGLSYNATELANLEWHDKAGKNYWVGAYHCLPVLRSFADLCTPLADGTVPAVALASLIYAGSDEPISDTELHEISAGFGHFNELVVTVDGAGIMCIYADWLIDTYGNCMVPPSAYTYLRSQHFAVGLESHQYIQKQPPAPAAPATV